VCVCVDVCVCVCVCVQRGDPTQAVFYPFDMLSPVSLPKASLSESIAMHDRRFQPSQHATLGGILRLHYVLLIAVADARYKRRSNM
jgi:hypothetical protein